jgi:hypothetical protein
MAQSLVTYMVPTDVDERVLRHLERLVAQRDSTGTSTKRITKAGDALRYVLDLAEIAESMGIQPERPVNT